MLGVALVNKGRLQRFVSYVYAFVHVLTISFIFIYFFIYAVVPEDSNENLRLQHEEIEICMSQAITGSTHESQFTPVRDVARDIHGEGCLVKVVFSILILN